MAQTSRNLSITSFAQATRTSPSSVYDISSKDTIYLSRNTDGSITSYLLAKFENWPSNLAYRRLYGVEVIFNYASAGISFKTGTAEIIYDGRSAMGIEPLVSTFNPSTATWTNKPEKVDTALYLKGSVPSDVTSYSNRTLQMTGQNTITDSERSWFALQFLKSCAFQAFAANYGNYVRTVYAKKKLTDGTSNPYVKIYYDDSVNVSSKITVKSGPSSGYVNPRNATSFSWAFERDSSQQYYCIGTFAQASAVFHWKASGGSWNTINASSTSLTVPANTFTAGTTIEWYLTGTDTGGTSSESTHYTFSTAAASAVCTNISPVSSVEDGRAAITFKWNIVTSDGMAASRVELWWKLPTESSNQWHEIADVNQPITQYTVPAGYFNAGETQWLVHAYNIDGTKGPDAITSFIVLNAPNTPVVTTDSAPFTTVTWQAEGQQSYEIQIDDRVYGSFFGTEKTFTAPDFLKNGEHVARVRVMGVYGLWSDWGQVTFTVSNQILAMFELTSKVKEDFRFEWIGQESGDYLVYRDNVQIAHVTTETFVDRVALGTHDYFVVSRYSNGHYKKSNTITKTASVECLYIALLEGGNWVKIEHKLKSTDVSYSDTQSVFYNQLAGHTYPIVDISEFEDRTVEYSAVFFYNEEEERRQFVSMFGKPVILKTPDDEVVIGILENWKKSPKKYAYTAYTFTIRRIDWSDYIDLS